MSLKKYQYNLNLLDDGGSVFGWNSFEFMGDVGSLFTDQTEPFHPLAFLSVRLQGNSCLNLFLFYLIPYIFSLSDDN